MRVLGAPVWTLFRSGMARFFPADPGRLYAVGIGGGGGGGGARSSRDVGQGILVGSDFDHADLTAK